MINKYTIVAVWLIRQEVNEKKNRILHENKIIRFMNKETLQQQKKKQKSRYGRWVGHFVKRKKEIENFNN